MILTLLTLQGVCMTIGATEQITKAAESKLQGKKNDKVDALVEFMFWAAPGRNIWELVRLVSKKNREELALIKNKKEYNRMYQCKNCGVMQRKYQHNLKNDWSAERIKCKECNHDTERVEFLDEEKIVMAKKANVLTSFKFLILDAYCSEKDELERKKLLVKKFLKNPIEEYKNHRAFKKWIKSLESFANAYVNDVQLEAYSRIKEEKMDKYLIKSFELQKELEKQKRDLEKK